jgi:iron(III) transport system ATP-binding protein
MADIVLKPPAVATTGAAHIRIRDLTKRFGTFTALKAISLDIGKSEFVCFLGPSGCGKTTLLRAIAGLDPQDNGHIEIAGRDVSNLPPAARDFGIVFQSYALFPNLTVAKNVGYGLVNRRRGSGEIAARVSELLALVGLPEQGLKYPAQLSGGQQQRVALARALATSPGLLLLDEPLSALDARVRVRLRDEIKHLQRRLGVTTIMVTHDQEEAMSMADRIVVMNQGVIEQIGTPAEIYARPATEFVADFIGHMVFLDGTVAWAGAVDVQGLKLLVQDQGTLVATGAKARLGIRPEEVQVRGVTAETPNRLDVVVKSGDYLGSFCRLTLAAVAHPGMTIMADLSSNDVRDLDVSVGNTIAIALPAKMLRVFPAKI